MSGPRRARLVIAAGVVAILVAVGGLAGDSGPAQDARAAAGDEVSILFGLPNTLDPAHQSDIGSAAFGAQLYETLTTFDTSLTLRPALAGSWDISDDGRQIVFHLRDGLTFSDGSPLGAEDVVGSWLRVIDPDDPSLLWSLLLDVRGAFDYVSGATSDPDDVGIRAAGRDVVVDLVGPGADFPSVVASPTFGIVPAAVWRDGEAIDGGVSVGSGAYVVASVTPDEYTLVANERYWAGTPAIRTVHLLTNIGGRSEVAAFEDGELDYTSISWYDASWIRFDARLGPQLRLVPSLSLSYVGFTTTAPPFDDERVRQAFGAAVDWTRIVELGSAGDEIPADSMVPPGIPGRGDRSWIPAHDPEAARALLAEAGYPGGAGFPEIGFAAGGLPYAESIVADLERELGVAIRIEEYDDHFGRLHQDPLPMWTLGWVADYPGPNDFLGVLLGTGSSNNYGHWSSPTFDAAIEDALATRDPDEALAAWERALGAVRDEVPAVPIAYGDSWALSREGLLGAGQNGMGILRIGGMAWQ
ncbi:MAG: peptide ABC transporter substrate-binding protein [Chloroflexota bacterium]|nr:MAG: peptide ABC transporter substrate-binding protein [Chloroflexota bacterium]